MILIHAVLRWLKLMVFHFCNSKHYKYKKKFRAMRKVELQPWPLLEPPISRLHPKMQNLRYGLDSRVPSTACNVMLGLLSCGGELVEIFIFTFTIHGGAFYVYIYDILIQILKKFRLTNIEYIDIDIWTAKRKGVYKYREKLNTIPHSACKSNT